MFRLLLFGFQELYISYYKWWSVIDSLRELTRAKKKLKKQKNKKPKKTKTEKKGERKEKNDNRNMDI